MVNIIIVSTKLGHDQFFLSLSCMYGWIIKHSNYVALLAKWHVLMSLSLQKWKMSSYKACCF